MKYDDITSASEQLSKIKEEMAEIKKDIDRRKYVHLPSEIERGTVHKIERDDREWYRVTKDLREQWNLLKHVRDSLEYRIKELQEDGLRMSRRKPEEPKEYVYDLRTQEEKESDPPPIKFNPEDWLFSLDFDSLASRRKARLGRVVLGGHAHHDGDYMSHQNSVAILEQAIFVAKAIEAHTRDGHRMEDWLEDKISKIADDMDEVYKYLRNGRG
jgi:hypothetical protein